MQREQVYHKIIQPLQKQIEDLGYYVGDIKLQEVPKILMTMSERNPIFTNVLNEFMQERATLDFIPEKEKRLLHKTTQNYIQKSPYASYFEDRREYEYYRHATEEAYAEFFTNENKKFAIKRERGKGFVVELIYNKEQIQRSIEKLVKDYIATKEEEMGEEDSIGAYLQHMNTQEPTQPTKNRLGQVRRKYEQDTKDVERLKRLMYLLTREDVKEYMKALNMSVRYVKEYNHIEMKRKGTTIAVHPHYIVDLGDQLNKSYYKRTQRNSTSSNYMSEGEQVFYQLLRTGEASDKHLKAISKRIYISYTLSVTKPFMDMK